MVVISCCAINRLSVSCPVFCVVEHLVIKTVEKKTFKTSQTFSLWLLFNCLWLQWWHCTCQRVGRPGVAAGLGMGVALAGGTCTLSEWHCPHGCVSSCKAQPPCKGSTCLLQARMCGCVSVCLGVYLSSSTAMSPTQLFLELAGSAIPCPLSGTSSLRRKSCSWGELVY